MKRLITTTVLAVSAFTVAATNAHATKIALTQNPGDLIFGVEFNNGSAAQGVTTNLMVDLGPASQFYNATPGTTFTLPALEEADLEANYTGLYQPTDTNNTGATPDWFLNYGVLWGVAGSDGNSANSDGKLAHTVWSTSPENAAGYSTALTSRGALTDSSLQTASADIATMTNYMTTLNQINTTTDTHAGKGSSGSSSSFYSEEGNNNVSSFGVLNPIATNSYANAVGSAEYSALWEQQPSASGFTTPGTSTYLGYFKLSSAGVLTFTAAPEPSAVTLAIGAGLAMFASRRRRVA